LNTDVIIFLSGIYHKLQSDYKIDDIVVDCYRMIIITLKTGFFFILMFAMEIQAPYYNMEAEWEQEWADVSHLFL